MEGWSQGVRQSGRGDVGRANGRQGGRHAARAERGKGGWPAGREAWRQVGMQVVMDGEAGVNVGVEKTGR